MSIKYSVKDRAVNRKQKEYAHKRFARAKNAGKHFNRQLLAVAKQVGAIVRGFAPNGRVKDLPALTDALARYSELIAPWAVAVSAEMIQEVDKRDATAWMQVGKDINRNLKEELNGAPTGLVMKQMLEEQVRLIKSLPLEAAQRVRKLTTESFLESGRADEIAKEIARSGEVTESRAKLIARTEVARTASVLTQTRAEFVGATHYVWETSEDGDVRESHKKMQGEVVAFDEPPLLDGLRYNAGAGPNCRCFMRPIIPD